MPPAPWSARAAPRRAARPDRLPPARAVAGAGVAVAGVVLGIGTLLWATGGRAPQGDPTVHRAVVAGSPSTPATQAPALDVPAVDDVPAVPAETAPPAPAPPPPPAPPAAAAVAPAREPVLVVNNSRIRGLAETAARRFSAGGWPVTGTDSVSGTIRQTTVYYPPGLEGQARAFARQFGIPRVLPRLAALPGSGLTVVVTRDFAS